VIGGIQEERWGTLRRVKATAGRLLRAVAERTAGVRGRLEGRGLLVVAMLVLAVLYCDRYLSFPSTPGGDGLYSWVYARSMAFDGDLHLANDYAACGDPWHLGVDYGAGRPADPFYFGSALIWTPLLWIARHVVHLPPGTDANALAGCSGPLTRVVGFSGVALALGTLLLGYAVARRWASRPASLVAMMMVGLGSSLTGYGTTGWFASHVGSAFAVALALLLWVRATEAPSSYLRPTLAGMALGFAALVRPNEVAWGVGPCLFVLGWIVRDARARKLPRDGVVFGVLFVLGFASVFWIQFFVWKTLYGSWVVSPTGKLYLQPFHAHPFLLLFSSRSGFLVFTPLMWVGFLGLFLHSWRKGRSSDPALGRMMVACTLASIWFSSSPIAWTGGYTLSARLLTSLAGPFVATGALFLDRVLAWGKKSESRRWFLAAVLMLPIFMIAWGIGKPNRVSASQVTRGPDIYSAGAKGALDEVYEVMGNPFNLPATLVFAARYRLAPRHFDSLATEGLFQHDYRTTALVNANIIDLKHPPAEVVVPPRHADERGLAVRRTRPGRFLVTLGWPWVTHLTLTVLPADQDGVKMSVKVRGFFTSHVVQGIEIGKTPGELKTEIAVAPRAFDSGINEIVIESNADVFVSAIELHDRTKHDTRVK